MFDYLMAWTKDKDLRSLGVVAFIGADDKAFCSDQSIILSSAEKKHECKSIGNDGVRGRAGKEEEKPEEQKQKKTEEGNKFEDEGNCFSWEEQLGLSEDCGSAGNIKEKAEVGQMYGLSKGDSNGFKKLKGLVVHV